MKRPALIFDFGNVVAFFDYTRAAERLGRSTGRTGPEFLAHLRAKGFDPLLKQYESGGISCEEFSRSIGEIAGVEYPHDEFVAHWSDIFTINGPVAGLIGGLKSAGYTLVLGSNTNAIHAGQFRRQFAEVLDSFDALVLSYQVGAIKPSAEFYHACAKAANAERAECVFIDDLAENVEGARQAGLSGIHFVGIEPLVNDLERLGISAAASYR